MTLQPDFVLPVDKPEGPTSHDVVSAARRGLGTRKIGHTGTLDPFASGLLVLCVGRATRLAEYVSGMDKSYEAVARLGTTTDTLDREGAVLEERGGWEGLTEADIGSALDTFVGDLLQVPPQFSAKKVDGVAMHRRARSGEHVELQPCAVSVRSIELVEVALPDVRFRLRCSTGTYVRAIARDLGEALGVGAHLIELRRSAIGGFHVDSAIAMDRLGDPAAVAGARIDPLAALAHLPSIEVDAASAERLAHGQHIDVAEMPSTELVAVASAGKLLAVGEVRDGELRPRKVFVS